MVNDRNFVVKLRVRRTSLRSVLTKNFLSCKLHSRIVSHICHILRQICFSWYETWHHNISNKVFKIAGIWRLKGLLWLHNITSPDVSPHILGPCGEPFLLFMTSTSWLWSCEAVKFLYPERMLARNWRRQSIPYRDRRCSSGYRFWQAVTTEH